MMWSPRSRLPEVQQAVLTGPVASIDAVVGALRASDRQGEIAASEYRSLDLVKAIRLGRAAEAQYLTSVLMSQAPESLRGILQAVEQCPERQESWFRSVVEIVRNAASEPGSPVSYRERSGTVGSGRLPVAARVSLLVAAGAIGLILGIGMTMYWLVGSSTRSSNTATDGSPQALALADAGSPSGGDDDLDRSTKTPEPGLGATRGPGRKGLEIGTAREDPMGGTSGGRGAGASKSGEDRGEGWAFDENEPESPSPSHASEVGNPQDQTADLTKEAASSTSPAPTRADLLRSSREGIEEGRDSARRSVSSWDGRIPVDLRASVVKMGRALRQISLTLRGLDAAVASGTATPNGGPFASYDSSELDMLRAVERTRSVYERVQRLIHDQSVQSAREFRHRLEGAGIVLVADPEQRLPAGVDDRWFAWCGTDQDLFLDHLRVTPPDPADIAGSIAAAHPEWVPAIDFSRSHDRLYQAWRVFQALEDCSKLGRMLRLQVGQLDERNPARVTRRLLDLEVGTESVVDSYGRRQPGPGQTLRAARVKLFLDLTTVLEDLAMIDDNAGLGAVLDGGVSRDRDGHALGWMLHEQRDLTQSSRPLALLKRLRIVTREFAEEARTE